MFRSLAISLVVAVLTAQTAAAGGGEGLNGSEYDHNGSHVWVDPEHGDITYD